MEKKRLGGHGGSPHDGDTIYIFGGMPFHYLQQDLELLDNQPKSCQQDDEKGEQEILDWLATEEASA